MNFVGDFDLKRIAELKKEWETGTTDMTAKTKSGDVGGWVRQYTFPENTGGPTVGIGHSAGIQIGVGSEEQKKVSAAA